MHKKAFSLVELTIVLVVIGVIVLVAMRSISIKRTALIKAEITKINSFIVAVNNYILLTGDVPPAIETDTAGNYIGNEIFYGMNLLTTAKTSYLEGGEWRMMPCGIDTPNEWGSAPFIYNEDSFDLCARVDEVNMNAFLVCSIEATLDMPIGDGTELLRGTGRLLNSRSTAGFTSVYSNGCAAAQSSPPVPYAYKIYTGSDAIL